MINRFDELAAKSVAIAADPLNWVEFNPAQVRFIDACRNPDPESLTLVLLLKGNRAGGSYGLVSIWSAIMRPTRNPLFRGSPFYGHWPFPSKSIRIVAPKASLADEGPIQAAMKELLPKRCYQQNKGSGFGYFCQGTADGGWNWDTITIDQPVLQAAGANKGLTLISEPCPKDIFVECVTRLSGQGILIGEMTRLDMAAFIQEYVDAGALILDGRKVGEVRVVRADIHDACRECNGGHLPHSAIEAIIASWPIEERHARKTGDELRLSGRIYQSWGEANELDALPKYHQERWDRGEVRISSLIDPHDRLPWACIWVATFPNEDAIVIGEWPPFDFAPCKMSPVSDIEDYRGIILEAEAQLPTVSMRYMDPLFSEAPGKGNSKTIKQMLANPCRACLKDAGAQLDDDDKSEAWGKAADKCKHRLRYSGWPAYSGSVNAGHILVRAAIGGNGVRPKLYALKSATPNFVWGMRHYAFKEDKDPSKAISEKPEYVAKHYPDDIRGGFMMGFEKWPAEAKSVDLSIPLATMRKNRRR